MFEMRVKLGRNDLIRNAHEVFGFNREAVGAVEL
jgi:hypothetical protein